MKSHSSRDLIQIITADGWYFVRAAGDQHQYKHPTKPGKVTITHSVKDVPIGTVRSIFKHAGLQPRDNGFTSNTRLPGGKGKGPICVPGNL
ncbi:type II toxin-antitoxin system HicA family toxin [Alicyclobacillus sp. ALC3]|uniref:type II toxin-antitoxin system HicA family toxin n=1 Tax=Alicyclobacillus sp. ALC3 TaxID=2796143 RepID=UPI0027A89235|nr:type II toxin-antitoxin system HicA family toxin [Alicyclobacillus sp. ALC3]